MIKNNIQRGIETVSMTDLREMNVSAMRRADRLQKKTLRMLSRRRMKAAMEASLDLWREAVPVHY